MLQRHYSPITKIYLETNIREFIKNFSNKKIGLLLFCKEIDAPQVAHQEVLSRKGDLKEAAFNLYAALHHLDKLHLDLIVAERLPDSELGVSINDRLERAKNDQ